MTEAQAPEIGAPDRQAPEASERPLAPTATGSPLISVIILAAGMGTRLGGPKIRMHVLDGRSLLSVQVSAIDQALREAGHSAEILVVVGAGILGIDDSVGLDHTTAHLSNPDATDSRLGDLLPSPPASVRIIPNPNFASGMGSSVKAGLRAISAESAAAVITLLDLPDIPPVIYPRLAGLAAPGALARCTWGDRPGHPVLIGRDWIAEAIEACRADAGAKALFRDHANILAEVDGSDLVTDGADPRRDVDSADDAAVLGLVLGAE